MYSCYRPASNTRRGLAHIELSAGVARRASRAAILFPALAPAKAVELNTARISSAKQRNLDLNDRCRSGAKTSELKHV
jgi:hypothetical protein